jgi:hypothetical protein
MVRRARFETGVQPRANDQALAMARLGRGGVLAQPDVVVDHSAHEGVVPAGHVQRRRGHAPVIGGWRQLSPVRILSRVLQPLPQPRRQPLQRIGAGSA